LRVPAQILDAIQNHAESCAPEEACGLLASDGQGAFKMVYCLTNSQHSPSAYTVDPVEHFRAMRHAEMNGWHLSGVFHSHPLGDPFPSATDRALAMEPEWVYLIAGSDGTIRAYHLRAGSVEEVPIEVEA
jgi:proteasome lid subunit RPN8/RPN11